MPSQFAKAFGDTLTRLKISSRDLQTNCAISFCFYLYLMLHACAVRFDVTRNLEKFLVFWWELNKA